MKQLFKSNKAKLLYWVVCSLIMGWASALACTILASDIIYISPISAQFSNKQLTYLRQILNHEFFYVIEFFSTIIFFTFCIALWFVEEKILEDRKNKQLTK